MQKKGYSHNEWLSVYAHKANHTAHGFAIISVVTHQSPQDSPQDPLDLVPQIQTLPQ